MKKCKESHSHEKNRFHVNFEDIFLKILRKFQEIFEKISEKIGNILRKIIENVYLQNFAQIGRYFGKKICKES